MGVDAWETYNQPELRMEEIWHNQGVNVDVRDKESCALREFTFERESLENLQTSSNQKVNSKRKSSKMRLSVPDMTRIKQSSSRISLIDQRNHQRSSRNQNERFTQGSEHRPTSLMLLQG